ncbi:hypothetical protein J4Q44_G00339070 [Coregonus suidteri]|uniref:Uncharacterized protein n=1 Tax=Coregonus suidteri TaxID=861788 RepID=A0AAN8Q992_9TELE
MKPTNWSRAVQARQTERAKSAGTETRGSVVAMVKKWINHDDDALISTWSVRFLQNIHRGLVEVMTSPFTCLLPVTMETTSSP